MGTEINLTFSSTVVTDVALLSDGTTDSFSDGERFLSSDEENARLIQIVARPILILMGTVGNGLTIYIMRSTSLNNVSSCSHMCILALADTCKWVAAQKLLFSSKF